MPRFIRIKPLSTVYKLSIVIKPTLAPACLINPHIGHKLIILIILRSTNFTIKIIIHLKMFFTLDYIGQLRNSYIFTNPTNISSFPIVNQDRKPDPKPG